MAITASETLAVGETVAMSSFSPCALARYTSPSISSVMDRVRPQEVRGVRAASRVLQAVVLS